MRFFFNRRARQPADRAPRARSRYAVAESERTPIVLYPVGVVRNDVHDFHPRDWEHIESTIHIEGPFMDGLSRLEDFSHVLVLTWLHEAAAERTPPLRFPLSHDPEGRAAGVFALRTAVRPNCIGFTVARLLAVEGDRLTVEGLDVIDGTPVLDLKPYLPAYDAVAGARLPQWARRDAGGDERRRWAGDKPP